MRGCVGLVSRMAGGKGGQRGGKVELRSCVGVESGGQEQKQKEKNNRSITDMFSHSHSPCLYLSLPPPFLALPPPDLLPDGRAWLETSRGSSIYFFC